MRARVCICVSCMGHTMDRKFLWFFQQIWKQRFMYKSSAVICWLLTIGILSPQFRCIWIPAGNLCWTKNRCGWFRKRTNKFACYYIVFGIVFINIVSLFCSNIWQIEKHPVLYFSRMTVLAKESLILNESVRLCTFPLIRTFTSLCFTFL